MPKNCPVCKMPADSVSQRGSDDILDVSCPRCGTYRISASLAATNLENYGKRHIISGIIRNLFEKGEKLELHSNNLSAIIESIRISENPFDTIDLLLQHILNRTGKLSNSCKPDHERDFPLLYLETPREYLFFVGKAQELGYLEPDISGSVKVTLDGWKRLTETTKSKKQSKQAFVAMWFNPELDSAWENGFKTALVVSGFKPIRIDLQEHNEKICDRIISEIRKSGLVIADFTGHRGGVYFEAGFALGLNIPVIWSCKESDIDNLHFDTRQYNHIIWKNPEDLKTKLVNRIQATLPLLLS